MNHLTLMMNVKRSNFNKTTTIAITIKVDYELTSNLGLESKKLL